MKKTTALITAVLVALALPASASAQRHHHRTHHARAHHAAVQREYWPSLEEWLTPQEGHEVETDVCAELDELATTGTAEAC